MNVERIRPPDHALRAQPMAGTPETYEDSARNLNVEAISTAQSLMEQDWQGAAQHAYRAAFWFHRLPEHMQRAYVISDLHDDDGPAATDSQWTASAFVAWLVYRCNRSVEGIRRTARTHDVLGRKIKAADATDGAAAASDTVSAPAPLSQAGLFS